MDEKLTIGKAASLSGLTAKTIRFYEDEGLIPRARRTESGYRTYSRSDVMRLQLVRRARLLGLDLPGIKSFLDRALDQSCAVFGDELRAVLTEQRAELERRISELIAMRDELDLLQSHITHCCEGCDPGQMASDCDFCYLITDDKQQASRNR